MAGAQFNKSHLLLIPEGEGPGGVPELQLSREAGHTRLYIPEQQEDLSEGNKVEAGGQR